MNGFYIHEDAIKYLIASKTPKALDGLLLTQLDSYKNLIPFMSTAKSMHSFGQNLNEDVVLIILKHLSISEQQLKDYIETAPEPIKLAWQPKQVEQSITTGTVDFRDISEILGVDVDITNTHIALLSIVGEPSTYYSDE